MNIIVTGGLGFIGRNLVRELLKDEDNNILVIDNLSNSELIDFKCDRVKVLISDVIDIHNYVDALKEADYIYYLSCCQISLSSQNVSSDLNANAIGVIKILDYIKTHKINIKRFVYTSSCSVYGDSDNIHTEDSKVSIKSIYASTKFLGENYCNNYFEHHGIPISIIRYSNVYGLDQNNENGKVCGVIGKFITEALQDKAVLIYGNGDDKRDYTFISDVIDATILTAKADKAIGETYNTSNSISYSVNDIIKMIGVHGAIKSNCVEGRDIDNIKNRVISFDKIRNDLGWSPKVGIIEGIKKSIFE